MLLACAVTEASTRLDVWPGTCPAHEDDFQKGAKPNGVFVPKSGTDVLLSSWIYAGAAKQEVQHERPARAQGLWHKVTAWGRDFRRDLLWTSRQKH